MLIQIKVNMLFLGLQHRELRTKSKVTRRILSAKLSRRDGTISATLLSKRPTRRQSRNPRPSPYLQEPVGGDPEHGPRWSQLHVSTPDDKM